MKWWLLNNFFIVLTAAFLSTLASAEGELPYYNSAEFTPYWLHSTSPELKNFHRIANFSFTNQDGKTITQKTVANKIYVASFFFTSCPGVCPAIRSKLVNVQNTFINDPNILILSHSVNPSTDSVQVLKDYALEHGIKSKRWHLLTGDKEKIYRLAKKSYFASEDLGEAENLDDFLHTESLLLVDQLGYIRGIYNGLNTSSIENLIADINTLKNHQEK